jgi:hypothetical protein
MWVDMQDRRGRADQCAAKGLEQLALLRHGDALGARARSHRHTQSSSFSCDLKKWMQIAEGYEKGQHAYHTTMPTDALVRLRDVMLETRAYGFAKVREEQIAWAPGARAAGVARLSQRGGRGLKAPAWW